MQIKIKVIKVEVENKGKYSQATVAYNDLDKGKIAQKKIMSFTFKDVYNVVKEAKDGEVYQVSLKKNDESGYWDWIEITKADETSGTQETGSSQATAARSNSTPRSTYETPEERAKKQVYIVRQSALSTAVNVLAVGAKIAPKSAEIIALAKEFEAFVFGCDPVKELIAMPNDLPEDVEVN